MDLKGVCPRGSRGLLVYNTCLWISDEIDKSEVNLHEFNCTVYIFITKFVVSLRFFTSL